MKKTTLNKAVEACRTQTKEALQTVYDALNQGQRKKIVKDEKIKALFDLHGVEYDNNDE